ncbi:MAG: iron-containing alcohol dehydrogenase [Salinivirgaceae bacterium]|nr:iron-containing alcohol dehydrogenase [Salinivirgaceae bacterium]
MNNFDFYNPVKIAFGKGKISEINKLIPANAKILMLYGGGSIKKNGIYKQAVNALENHDFIEFSGIEPNPRYETAMKAVELVKKEKIDFLLAVGGGSVIDATKFIAAAAKYEGDDPWDILANYAKVTDALPIGTILTLPATGSEMNGNSVLTKAATKEKLAFGSPLVLPKFSILDPEVTYSLPKRQLINGVIDAYVHVIEQYLTYPVNSPVQDRFAEGILLTLIEEGKKALQNEQADYENRANIMWAATMALNGLIGVGVKTDWATHTIGHEFTALHGLDHAITLAIVLPGLLTKLKEKRSEKLLQYASRVWGIYEGSDEEKIQKAIEKTDAFFRELGAKTLLSEHEIGKETIQEIISRFENRKMAKLGMQQDVSLADVQEILESRM